MTIEREETHGRLKLIVKDTFSSIIEKEKLADSFDKTPRRVLHVGKEKYILSHWKQLIKNRNYLKD